MEIDHDDPPLLLRPQCPVTLTRNCRFAIGASRFFFILPIRRCRVRPGGSDGHLTFISDCNILTSTGDLYSGEFQRRPHVSDLVSGRKKQRGFVAISFFQVDVHHFNVRSFPLLGCFR